LLEDTAMDNLAAGNLFAELQIASWPLPVTQTLLRKSDGRLALTVRGKPSGRLRIALERVGYEPIVVRTMHLGLRAPTVLKVNVVWRGDVAAVVAAGQVIGNSQTFAEGVVTPAEVEQTAAPTDHVDNGRMRDLRRRQVAAFVSGSISAGAAAEHWLADLGEDIQVLGDLAGLVLQGRRHHLPGLLRAIRLLVLGDEREPALLQFCAGLVDAPLILYAPVTPTKGGGAPDLLAAAFDVAAARDPQHELAIDLDAWLRQEVPWTEGNLPIGWLLRQVGEVLQPDRMRQNTSVMGEDVRSSPAVVEALGRLALCLCRLAEATLSTDLKAAVEAPTERAAP
jgi:hypothetical protein